MRLEAFAKINWSLDITGVRPDGYHLMDMLMQPVSLADEITLTPAADLRLTTAGYPPTRADATNLAFRAAAALKQATGFSGGAAIHVHKAIPMGAGMGGGSADAAAVLWGLNRLWQTGLSPAALEEVGLTLGADVPFLLRGGLARVSGIGEAMTSLEDTHNYWLLVTQPCQGLSTARIFSLWREEASPLHPRTADAQAALCAGDLPALARAMGNVLQPVAERLRPEIGQACKAFLQNGAAAASMTGSGSAVFGVFASRALAQKAHRALQSRWRSLFLCHSQHDSIRITEE